ncbi:hypothetical protein O181_046071 [Austropuccinia psidii MF-1]|uniref:Reverse transcriptase Ty1/copia-type domain-containing protein n=1 Tax=Austropuccinia psidii MF-1 TaxID=1389203 RepID=A0A9Q3DLA7_9BASI|nr:hypothetical protein [Austropuccinia psidii MF-1]
MDDLKVWDMVDIDPSYKLVGTTWVFKIKKNHLNKVVNHKACLCAQELTQTFGVYFKKTYSPTGWLNSLRVLIAFAATNCLLFHQIDMKSAFLNAPLSKMVFLSILQGVNIDRRKICLCLNRAIYGLKQVPLVWYQPLKDWLFKVGFAPCTLAPCILYWSAPSPIWLYVHVDEITILGKEVASFKSEISSKLKIKDLGKAELLLGIRVAQGEDCITLDTQHFAEALLELYGIGNCCTVSTPLVPNQHLSSATDEEKALFVALGISYRSSVGSINYLSTATWPDLLHAVSSVSQLLEHPGINHWKAFLHVLWYLKGSQDFALTYKAGSGHRIVAYSNTDWENCTSTRRSITGYLVWLNNCFVVWNTMKQPTVSLSTSEAEYMSLCNFTSEFLWLRQ